MVIIGSAAFLKTCFLIILNFDILIYGLLYIFFSLCGQGIGFLVRQLRKNKKSTKKVSKK